MKAKEREQLDHFRQLCKAHGLSMTPQRVAIYKVLIASPDHPAAEDVLNLVRVSFPDISIDTVYRTLTTFSEIGLINLVEGYGQAKRYDPDVQTHHHFRCRQCGRIIDFQDEHFNNLPVPEWIEKKYSVSSLKVVLEGLCDKCSSHR